MQAASEDAANHIPRNVSSVAGAIGGVLNAAGMAGDLIDVGKDYTNPFIDENRKTADVATKALTVAGVSLADRFVAGFAGVALASVPGVAIAVGVGVGFAVLDKEFHISSKVSDGINSAIDAGGEALNDVGDAIGGLF